MIAFLALCALLVAVALVFLAPPLMKRLRAPELSETATNAAIYNEQLAGLDAELRAGAISREQWSTSRGELERRVLDEAGGRQAAAPASRSRLSAAVIGIAVPVAAVALYALLGTPEALSPQSAGSSSHEISAEQIADMAARLAARLQNEPDDITGWIMLARSYAVLGRHAEAAAAYAKATARQPADAQLLADYADTLAMARGRNLAGEPEALIARALAADGNNLKALALAGTVAFERRDYAGAVAHWRRILGLVPEDSPFVESVRASISEAEMHLRQAPTRIAERDGGKRQNVPLQGKVSLAPEAAGKVRPDDSVFIFARAAQGPRMPLAVLRRQVKDLPFEFSLDDSMAMTPELKLSSFDKVVVVARVSRSGLAAPQKGDLEAATAPVAPGTRGIRLELSASVAEGRGPNGRATAN